MPNKKKTQGKKLKKILLKSELNEKDKTKLLNSLEERFLKHSDRHPHISWSDVKIKIENNQIKLLSLLNMQVTDGEPDVIEYDEKTREYIFCDFSKESPTGRRNICYDHKGQNIREKKGIFPSGNAIDIANLMGIEILDKEHYQQLQKLGEFDTKTSSWLKTPKSIRELGGAIFGDRRYDHVFVYHNSAPSFYSSRGFRGILRV